MSVQDVIVTVVLIAAVAYAIIRRVRRNGRGDCGCGCGKNCPNCRS